MRNVLFIVVALFWLTVNANAALVIDWSFQNTNQSFSLYDTVIQYGRITNLPQNSGSLIQGNITNASLSPVLGYDAVLGTNGMDFLSQFSTMDVYPGESFDFIFATYTPVDGITAGSRIASSQTIFLHNAFPSIPGSLQPDRSQNYISNSFEWTVNELGSNAVPEPATVLLFGIGGAGMLLRRLRQRNI